MSGFAISEPSLNTVFQPQIDNTGTAATTESNRVSQKGSNVQGFAELVATQPGVMASLLHGQSLMTAHDVHPALSAPAKDNQKIGAEQTAELVKLSANLQGGDVNKLERAAVFASTVFSSQINIIQPNNKATATSKSAIETQATSSAFSSHPARSQAAVEGGTDITAIHRSGPGFINVMGDMKMVALNNQLTVTLTTSESDASKAAAKSMIRAVESADRAGTKGIDAEKQRMNGAISSGLMGAVAQGGTTVRSVKALNKESKSISQNLGAAANLDKGVRQNQEAIKSSADAMLRKGKSLDPKVEATISQPHSESMYKSSQLRNAHNKVGNNTQKIRITSEYANQAIRSGQGVIEGSLNVEAAKESKQADLARADQTVNHEVANTQQQTSKKAAEAEAALNRIFESTLNNNNSAVSTIADRMR